MNGKGPAKSAWLVVAVSFGVLLAVAFGWPDARRGYTDFLSFYAGARLVGTPHLYSPGHAREIQEPYANPGEVRAYIRPPVNAVILWPLGRLPYRQAHLVWQVLNLLALAVFIRLWAPTVASVVLCCWYFPVWINFVLGQDIPLFLLCIASSAALLEKERRFLAGLVFALCGVKFHLLALVPLLAVARRLWRFLAGVVAGGAVMLAVSFAVAGWDWPVRYYNLLRMNERFQASQGQMANLKGLFFGLPGSTAWLLLAVCTVVAGAWYVIRRSDLRQGLACAVAGGLLISPHAYLSDCALLVPLLLVLAGTLGFDKAMAAWVLTGVLSLALTKPPMAFVGQLAIVLFFGWIVYDTYRNARTGTSLELRRG